MLDMADAVLILVFRDYEVLFIVDDSGSVSLVLLLDTGKIWTNINRWQDRGGRNPGMRSWK